MKGPQRKEALKEFSKYARAQVEQARQTEKVRCDCEHDDKRSHFPRFQDAADANALIMGYKALLRPQ